MQDNAGADPPSGGAVTAQPPPPVDQIRGMSPPQWPSTASDSHLFPSEIWLSAGVLLLGVIFVAVIWRLTASNIPGKATSIKAILVLSIIVGTLFLITAGFSSQSIAPAMGLFGTIAGYLLKDFRENRKAAD
jgi:hypothetical protein